MRAWRRWRRGEEAVNGGDDDDLEADQEVEDGERNRGSREEYLNCGIFNSCDDSNNITTIISDGVDISRRDLEMHHEKLTYKGGKADGYVVPLGPANLVFVVGARGMIGCGAFDVAALERFRYPAAKVKPTRGPSIADLEDLLAGEVAEANGAAASLGVAVGMSGKEALDLL